MFLSNIQQQIFVLVTKITGHQVEDLDLDLFLENDLGVDSIKMVELVNNFVQLVPREQQAKFLQAMPLQKLMRLETLKDMVQIAQEWLVSRQPHTVLDEGMNEQAPVNTIDQPLPNAATVEILHGQYVHLVAHWLINSTSLFATLRLQGTVDPQLIWESWQDLIARHPMLRSRFIIPAGANSFKDYQLEILEQPTPPEIITDDLRHLDSKMQEQALEKELDKWLNFTWKLTDWPLHQFILLRLEDKVYQLIFANEHIISDGLSNHIVLAEFLEIYSAKVAGVKPDINSLTSLENYRSFATAINAFQDAEEEQVLAEYLKLHGRESYVWNPANHSDTAVQLKFQNQAVCLGQEMTKQLIAKTRELRLPLNSLLAGAFLRTLAKFDDSATSFIIQIPTSGRIYPEADTTNVISSFAQNLALSFERPHSQENWEIFLGRVHQTIQNGLVKNYDKIQTKQIAKAFKESIPLVDGQIPEYFKESFSQSVKSNLYIPFTGRTKIKNSYGSLTVLDYRAGGMNVARTLDILQEIFNDSLHLFTSYDSNFFPSEVIENLLEEYIYQLKNLANSSSNNVSIKPNITDILDLSQVQTSLLTLTGEICHQSLSEQHLDLDLEADLGMDSLELIRIITRLEKTLGKVDRQRLFLCRSLGEMAGVIGQQPNSSQESFPVTDEAIAIPYLAILKQSQSNPDAIAILTETTAVTYQQLHQLSNQVAHYLRTQGVKPGVLVGILLQQSPLLWVGILGILKAGGAYVPIDHTYPVERIRYMIAHAEIGILLTEHQLIAQFRECYQESLPIQTVIFLDEGQSDPNYEHLQQIQKQQWSTYPIATPPVVNSAEDLMTVLYTSGSTGRPKGVMLNHQGYMNRLNWMQKTFQLTPGERVAQKTSCCFDISVWEIFWPLMVGATVCPVAREIVRDPWRLASWMRSMRINILHFVPSLFGEFLGALTDESEEFPHLRWLIFSGEALPIAFIQQWLDKYGDRVGLANLYGPTEASIDVTCHLIQERPGSKGETSIPIGQAIDNVYLVILDENKNPVPVGELGELWLGGIQLAQGYLKDPEKTAQAFPANPFAQIPGQTLYRTGDLAKQLPDGKVEYHGRIDHQVKIRGFRVELGEIENILTSHPQIKEAVVVALDYDLGQKRLIAGLAGEAMASQTLKTYLSKHLPHYMIPHRLEWFPTLPKNHNGKLDRKALMSLLQTENLVSPSSDPDYFPLGPGQRWLLSYFEPPYQWTGYTRFRYHQTLDAEVLRQSLQQLIKLHPSLRTLFVQKEGKWWQKVLEPSQDVNIAFYDGTQLEEVRRDQQIQQLVRQISQDFQIDQWPLFQMTVIKINDSCYEIVMTGHHLIGDLLSSRLLFQQLWSIYCQLLASPGESSPSLPTSSYLELTQLLVEAEQQGQLARHVDYWLGQFPSPQSLFLIPRDYPQGINLEMYAREETWTLSTQASTTLLTKGKSHYQCHVYELLLAPLYRLMSQWSQRQEVTISHRSHGRDLGNGKQFFEAVGNFAVNFPVGISVDAQVSWKQLIEQIQAKFAELPMNGVTFDWIGQQLPDYLYPDSNLTPIRANYLGNRTLTESDVFEFIPQESDRRLSPPEQKRTTLLEFFFTIVEGNLNLTIEYSQDIHRRETIQHLGASYLSFLEDLLAMTPPKATAVVVANQTQPQPLAGKVALLRGGDGELGQAIAQKLALAGAQIALVDAEGEEEPQTGKIHLLESSQTLSLKTDDLPREKVQKMVEKVVNHFGHLDILINLNELARWPLGVESDAGVWEKMIQANLFVHYHYCRQVIPHLLRRKSGKIINLEVNSSDLGYPLDGVIATARHGIFGLTKSLAEELYPHNIQVNTVCPVLTHQPFALESSRRPKIPLEAVIEVVLFLASPASDGITGECLKVFGKPDGLGRNGLNQESVHYFNH